ncbi:MAG: type III PLP-dependent enzyme [Planctomycetota bacterium]|nr:type III PLP-dependent enzyme [Planctomycetota bacterium]
MIHTERLVQEYFGVLDGELAVGGHKVSALAAAYGTPLFVYDAAILRRRLAMLRAAVPERVDVYFSIKANPNPAVASVFVTEGAGLEVASGAEFVRALGSGCPAQRILFAGPGKTAHELAYVVERGIGEIHVESDEELTRLIELDAPIHVAVRVNPLAAASGGAMRMGGQPSQFGIDEERIEEVIRRVLEAPKLTFSGVHMFAGTQILDAETLVNQWRHGLEMAIRASEISRGPIAQLDLGGGLGVPYFQNESPLDLEKVRELSYALFAELGGHDALASTQIVLEPGRFLAGPSGLYIGRATTVKQSRDKTFCVLDAGMHHHLAASGNLGQVIKRDYPILNASRAEADADTQVAVVGPLCTPLDSLGRKAMLPAATATGDLVAIFQSGAYGLTASPVGFLSQPMPAEVLVDGDSHRCIRERGTYEQPLVGLPR